MTQTLERFLANRQHGSLRKEILHGREHVVVPMTLMVPGVLNGSRGPLLYPIEEITRNYQAWNNVPITVNHPMDDAGEPISASEDGVLDKVGIGVVRKAVCNGKLKAEGWLDVEKVRRVNPQILNSIEAGKPVELSTGLFTDQEQVAGTHTDGRGYSFIARNYRPDHLAILPDQIGACSLRDGCGVLINKDADQPVTEEEFARFITVLANADGGFDSDEQREAFFGRLKGGQIKSGNESESKTGSAEHNEFTNAKLSKLVEVAAEQNKGMKFPAPTKSDPLKSRQNDPRFKDAVKSAMGDIKELRKRNNLPEDVEYELKFIPIDEAIPIQGGEDYVNESSKDLAKHIGKPFGSDRSTYEDDHADYAPVILDEKGRLLDGNHRHAARRMAGIKEIPALVPKKPTGNANPHGCNQHTGPDCGPGGKNDRNKGKAKGKRGGTKEAPKGRAPKVKPAPKKPTKTKAKPKGQGKDDGQLKRAEARMKGKAEPKAKSKPVKMLKDEDNTEPFAKLDREEPTPEQEKAFFGYEIPTAQIVDDGPEEPEVVEDKPAPMKVERSYDDPSRDKELDKFLAGLEKETATMKAKAGFGSKLLKKIKGFFTGNAALTSDQEQWLVDNGWVTLDSGTHINLGEGGEVKAGPKGLKGKDLDEEDKARGKRVRGREREGMRADLKGLDDKLSEIKAADKKADEDSKSYFGKGVLDKLSSFLGKFKGGNDYVKAGRALRTGAAKMGRKVGQYARTAEKLLDKLTGNEEGEVPDEVFADFLLNADGGFESDEQRMAFFGNLKDGDIKGGSGKAGGDGKAEKAAKDIAKKERNQAKYDARTKAIESERALSTVADASQAAAEVLKAKEDSDKQKAAETKKEISRLNKLSKKAFSQGDSDRGLAIKKKANELQRRMDKPKREENRKGREEDEAARKALAEKSKAPTPADFLKR